MVTVRSFRCVATLLAVTLTVLQGCATSVYVPLERTDGSVLAQLNADTFRVEYRVSPFTPDELLDEYLRLRSAELTLQQGYDYFSMMQKVIVVSYRKSASVTISMFKGQKPPDATLLFDAREVLRTSNELARS